MRVTLQGKKRSNVWQLLTIYLISPFDQILTLNPTSMTLFNPSQSSVTWAVYLCFYQAVSATVICLHIYHITNGCKLHHSREYLKYILGWVVYEKVILNLWLSKIIVGIYILKLKKLSNFFFDLFYLVGLPPEKIWSPP